MTRSPWLRASLTAERRTPSVYRKRWATRGRPSSCGRCRAVSFGGVPRQLPRRLELASSLRVLRCCTASEKNRAPCSPQDALLSFFDRNLDLIAGSGPIATASLPPNSCRGIGNCFERAPGRRPDANPIKSTGQASCGAHRMLTLSPLSGVKRKTSARAEHFRL